MAKLTDKQEMFAQLVVELGSQHEAYKRAYDTTTAKSKTLYEEASRLANTPKISARIQEIRDEVAIALLWKKVDSVQTLADVAKGITENSRPSDVVNAVKALNSMFGWDKQVVEHSGEIEHSADQTLAEMLTGGSKR